MDGVILSRVPCSDEGRGGSPLQAFRSPSKLYARIKDQLTCDEDMLRFLLGLAVGFCMSIMSAVSTNGTDLRF